MKKYTHAIVGGTFDRFHAGHKKLLDTTVASSDHVTIGITTEALYKNKPFAATIESYETRKEYIRNYLNSKNIEEKAEIISIDDIYGTSLTEKEIDAIFVTEENEKAADLINTKRKERGFSALEIVIVPFVRGNDGEVISSERIRKGEIDRSGNSYKLLFSETSLVLPQTLRALLREPIGIITQDLKNVKKNSGIPMVIAVGDIVALTFFANHEQADLSVVDFKTRRRELEKNDKLSLNQLQPTLSNNNLAGSIEKDAVRSLIQAIDIFLQTGEKQTLKIIGEEDLLTLPAILLAPLGSFVVYGQYDQGAVLVEVTEEKKDEVTVLVKQFEAT